MFFQHAIQGKNKCFFFNFSELKMKFHFKQIMDCSFEVDPLI